LKKPKLNKPAAWVSWTIAVVGYIKIKPLIGTVAERSITMITPGYVLFFMYCIFALIYASIEFVLIFLQYINDKFIINAQGGDE